MGRITLFTSDHCVHSLQMKNEMIRRKLPYTEISLTDFPEKRQDLFMLTRRMTTPQAFFNTRYVGGIEATLRLLKEWDRDSHYKSPAKKYEAQIAKFPDPSNPNLAVPTKSDSMKDMTANQTLLKPITVELKLPSGPQTYRVSDLQEELTRVLPLSSLPYHLTSYKHSVTGTQATAALKKHFKCDTREEAVEIGKQLNTLGLLWHVCYDHDFQDTAGLYYRLQCHQTPNVVNSLHELKDAVHNDVPKANGLVECMEALLYKLELECFSLEKGGIQYSKGPSCAAFAELQEGLCHFQTVGIDDMEPNQLVVSIDCPYFGRGPQLTTAMLTLASFLSFLLGFWVECLQCYAKVCLVQVWYSSKGVPPTDVLVRHPIQCGW